MASLFSASIIFNVYMAKETSALFFMMPCRLYQFCAGSIAVMLYDCVPAPIAGYFNVAGLLSILISFCVVRPEHNPIFLTSLPSVVGTALVIATPNPLTCRKHGLLLPQLTFLGNVSYSAYLVHWPAIVLSLSAIHGRTEAFLVAAALTCFSSLAMFYGIEESFRYSKKGVSVPGALLCCLGLFLCLVLISLGVSFRAKQAVSNRGIAGSNKAQGFVLKRFKDYWQEHANLTREMYRGGIINNGTGAPYVLFLGDSYVQGVLPVVDDTAHDTNYSKTVYYVSSPGCAPFPGNLSGVASRVNHKRYIEMCLTNAQTIDDLFRAREPSMVVLGLRWQDYLFDEYGQKLIQTGLKYVLQRTKRVVLNGSPPSPPYDPVNCLWTLGNINEVSAQEKEKCPQNFTAPAEFQKIEDGIDSLARMDSRISVIRFSETDFCEKKGAGVLECRVWTDGDGPMYYDQVGHLTLEGARKAASKLGNFVKAI